jgi:RNA polymerase sigma-70 factor (ECF subfamily)
LDRDERFAAEALPLFKALYATALRLTRNPQDAEDLVQETFLRAYRGFDRYSPGTNLRAWLYTILHRARTDAHRKAGRSPEAVELLDDGPGVAPPQNQVGAEMDLERALLRVPEVFREALILRDIEDWSYDEIARALEVPIGTVMSRIHRGRALLRQALAGPTR